MVTDANSTRLGTEAFKDSGMTLLKEIRGCGANYQAKSNSEAAASALKDTVTTLAST